MLFFDVGAAFNDDGGTSAGRAYLYSGLDSASLRTFTGDEAFSRLGESVSGTADHDGDGRGDLAVAAPSGLAAFRLAAPAHTSLAITASVIWAVVAAPRSTTPAPPDSFIMS